MTTALPAQKTLPPVHDWEAIRVMRGRLREELEELPEVIRDGLVMAATELVENGLLHTETPDDASPVVLEIYRSENLIELCVTNKLSSKDRAHSVIRRVSEIDALEDKQSAYVERLVALSRAPRSGTSQLGFHRVALEGGCSLRAVHDGSCLKVYARRAL
jgi:hypothetical protein